MISISHISSLQHLSAYPIPCSQTPYIDASARQSTTVAALMAQTMLEHICSLCCLLQKQANKPKTQSYIVRSSDPVRWDGYLL